MKKLIQQVKNIIDGEKEFNSVNTQKLTDLANHLNLSNHWDNKSECYHLKDPQGFEVVSVYQGFTLLCMEF